MPALPTSIGAVGSAAPRRPVPRMTISSGAVLDERAERARRRASVESVSAASQVAAHAHRHVGHRAEQRDAVRDRLVGRRRQRRRAAARSGRCGRSRDGDAERRGSARAPASAWRSATHSDTTPLRVVRRRAQRHVGDVHAGAAERRSRCRRSRRGGSGRRRGARAPGRRRGRPRAARGGGRRPPLPASSASWSSSASAERISVRRAIEASSAAPQRLAVGAVDAGPELGAAPATRVASRKLGPVAGIRSPPSAPAACATRTFASTCGRCETAAIVRSWSAGSTTSGRAPMPGQEAVHALQQHAARRRLRRQVPGRAVEEVLARVVDACDLGAGQRVAADEALVGARGLDDLALRRADVGHRAARRRRGEHVARDLRQHVDGRADDRDVGAVDGATRCPGRPRRGRRARRPAAPCGRCRGRARPSAGGRPCRPTRR